MRKKKTEEEKRIRRENDFKNKFKEKFGNEYEVISEYNSAGEKIEIKHLECGQSFWITYKLFQHSPRCRVCQVTPPNRYQKEEIEKILSEDPDYQPITVPEKITDYAEVIHKKCGTIYKVRASEFRNGHRCPNCASNYKPLSVFYDELSYNGLNEEYTLLNPEEYNGYSQKARFRHEVCGYEYSITPRRLIRGCRCAKCSGELEITEEEAKEKIFQKFDGDIEITQFNGWGKWGWVHCNRCGYDAYKLIKSLMWQNIGCINCQKILQRSNLSLWNNGFENLNQLLRYNLFDWKEASKKYWNYSCCISGLKNNLIVHHLFKPFSEIRNEIIVELNLEQYNSASEIPDLVYKQMIELNEKKHEENGYGVVLTAELHNEFHKKYGNKDNTPYQLIEFAKDKRVNLKIENNKLVKCD